jgi:hypothetical protein
MQQAFELKEKVATLQQALLDKHPTMPTLLREIHKTLKEQPENVVLLSEEEIAAIVNGLKAQTQTEFASIVTKSAKSTSAVSKIKSLGVDAF